MKIRFLGKNETYLEYSYTGPTLNDTDWENIENWTMIEDLLVDGGEF